MCVLPTPWNVLPRCHTIHNCLIVCVWHTSTLIRFSTGLVPSGDCSCERVKILSVVSHFTVSLILCRAMSRDSVHKPQVLKRKVSWSGESNLGPSRLTAERLTTRPSRLTAHQSAARPFNRLPLYMYDSLYERCAELTHQRGSDLVLPWMVSSLSFDLHQIWPKLMFLSFFKC